MVPNVVPSVPASNVASGVIKRSHESALGSDRCWEVYSNLVVFIATDPAIGVKGETAVFLQWLEDRNVKCFATINIKLYSIWFVLCSVIELIFENRYIQQYDITPLPTHMTRDWMKDEHQTHLTYWPNYLIPKDQWRSETITQQGLKIISEMEALHNQWRDFGRKYPDLEDRCSVLYWNCSRVSPAFHAGFDDSFDELLCKLHFQWATPFQWRGAVRRQESPFAAIVLCSVGHVSDRW